MRHTILLALVLSFGCRSTPSSQTLQDSTTPLEDARPRYYGVANGPVASRSILHFSHCAEGQKSGPDCVENGDGVNFILFEKEVDKLITEAWPEVKSEQASVMAKLREKGVTTDDKDANINAKIIAKEVFPMAIKNVLAASPRVSIGRLHVGSYLCGAATITNITVKGDKAEIELQSLWNKNKEVIHHHEKYIVRMKGGFLLNQNDDKSECDKYPIVPLYTKAGDERFQIYPDDRFWWTWNRNYGSPTKVIDSCGFEKTGVINYQICDYYDETYSCKDEKGNLRVVSCKIP